MKILNKIAEWFSRKTSARVNEEDTNICYPVQPVQSVHTIDALSIGICKKAYSADIFSSWLSSYFEKKISVAEIKATDFFANSSQTYVLTAFTYQAGKYVYWVQIGTWNIYKMTAESITTKPSNGFRLMLKDKRGFQYVALCTYEKESIIINKIVLGHTYPPTDDDEETAFKCSILPCSIDKALEFVKFL